MYLDMILEFSQMDELFETLLHPYTNEILPITPIRNPRCIRRRERIILKGEVPNPINPPTSYRFHT